METLRRIYRFFGRPPRTRATLTSRAVLCYIIVALSTFSFFAWRPIDFVCVLATTILGIKFFFDEFAGQIQDALKENSGKISLGVVGFVIFQAARIYAARAVQLFVQTNPDQFPYGEIFLTIAFIIVGIIVLIYLGMIIAFCVVLVVALGNLVQEVSAGPSIRRFYSLGYLFSAIAFAQFVLDIGNRNNFPVAAWLEEGFVATSFVPNDWGFSASFLAGDKVRISQKLLCQNLPTDAYVSFVNPDAVIPDEGVVMARPWDPPHPKLELTTYEYKLVKCVNSNGENHPHILETIRSTPKD